MSRPDRIAALLALTALAGCSFAPPNTRPALPVPTRYPAEGLGQADAARASSIGWQAFFADPRLRALIAMALANNRDLRIAVARIDEARGQYRIQDATRLPRIDASGSFTRTRTPISSLGTTGTAGSTGDGGVSSGSGGLTSDGNATIFNRYQIGVAVTSFELDFWGRVRNLSDAARSQYLSTVAAERAFRLSLVRDVATNYLTSRSLAERIAIAGSTVGSRGEGLRIAKLRMDAGVTSALDYRQAETLLTQAETELASLRLQQAQIGNFLAVLVGTTEDVLPAALPLADQGIVRGIGPGLPSDLLVDRPDIVSAEEQLRAARANIGAARAAFFPSISLTGSAGFSSNALDSLVGKEGLSWSFGPTISLPIFDWGARQGDLTVAKARENIAVSTYEQTVQTAFREVADGLAGRRYLAEQIAAQGRAVVAQRSLAGLARARYANGVAQYIEVLDAERNLFSAEQTMIELRLAELQNLVSLYVALGGGLGPAPTRPAG